MSWMLDFLGIGAKEHGILVLQPDESGKKLAGFTGGKSLTLKASPGETIASVMDKFNTYRGPDQQIMKLWDERGNSLPFSTVITGRIIVIVRESSSVALI